MNTPEPERNPYSVSPATMQGADAKPAGTSGEAALDAEIYSPHQIFAAAFIGAPLAAAWFLSKNYRALNQPDNASRMLWMGPIANVLVIAIAFVLPERTPNFIFPLVYSAALYSYASLKFDKVSKRHYMAGGKKGSSWRVVGMSLLWLLALIAVLLVVLIPLALVFPDLLPK